MLLTLTSKIKTLPSESTCKTWRKKTDKNYRGFCVVILGDTPKTCLNCNKWSKMRKIGTTECRKWWIGWDADKMTKKDFMQRTPKMRMTKRTFTTIIMEIESVSVTRKNLLQMIKISNSHHNKISNKCNKSWDTSLWIRYLLLKMCHIKQNLLNYSFSCHKYSKTRAIQLINILRSLILILIKRKLVKNLFKKNCKRKLIILLEIYSHLEPIRVKLMVWLLLKWKKPLLIWVRN